MLKIAGFAHNSVVDGPGVRETVFLQGCTHNCPGCHNPETHPVDGGEVWGVHELVDRLYGMCVDQFYPKFTISGGDPLLQPHTTALCWALKERNQHANIWLYTGYLWEEVRNHPALQYVDVLVDGPYIEDYRTLTSQFVGSRNQRLIDVQESLASGTTVLWMRPVIELQDSLVGKPLLEWLAKTQTGGLAHGEAKETSDTGRSASKARTSTGKARTSTGKATTSASIGATQEEKVPQDNCRATACLA